MYVPQPSMYGPLPSLKENLKNSRSVNADDNDIVLVLLLVFCMNSASEEGKDGETRDDAEEREIPSRDAVAQNHSSPRLGKEGSRRGRIFLKGKNFNGEKVD